MAKSGGTLRFTHLSLENWRNFTRVDATLGERMLVTGPSACGKSNLLDALRFLSDVAAGGGFQESVRRRGGVPRLRCLAAQQASQVSISVRVGGEEGEPAWLYELRFAPEALRKPVIVRERVVFGNDELLCRPDDADRDDPERLNSTVLESTHNNRRFRELARFFASIGYVHPCPEVMRRPGSELLAEIAATPDNLQHARFRRILEVIQPLTPQLEAIDFRRDSEGMPHLRARYGYSQGVWQTEEQLSDGTLRLIGIFWAAFDTGGPLLIEEPEQSLHPEAVRQVLPMLRNAQRRTGRQFLLTTNSNELLADDRIEPDDVLELKPGEDGTTARTPSCFAPGEEGQLALFA